MSSQQSPHRRSGVNEGGDPEKIITAAQWRKVLATDADVVFFGCRAAIPPSGADERLDREDRFRLGNGRRLIDESRQRRETRRRDYHGALAMDLGFDGLSDDAVSLCSISRAAPLRSSACKRHPP